MKPETFLTDALFDVPKVAVDTFVMWPSGDVSPDLMYHSSRAFASL